MKAILILVSLWVAWSTNVAAQTLKQAKLVLDSYAHDFGTIREVDGNVSHTFRYTNTGTLPLVIQRVQVSCGCTYPQFSREPLLPGKSAEMKITFDPTNRPGAFEKVISIVSNDPRGEVRLTLTGRVEGRPRTIQDDYPYSVADGVRVAERRLVLGTLPRGRVSQRTIGMANSGTEVVQVGVRGSLLPEWITVRPAKATLAPGERSTILLTFDASKADLWGKYRGEFQLVVNGQVTPDPIELTATFVEDFSAWSRTALRIAPRGEYSSFFYHFSDQPQGKLLTRAFQITNSGQTPLIIRHIGPTSSRISAKVDKTEIEAGDTATLTVSLDTRGVSGRLSEGITLVTNDPERPAREIRVLANIVR